MKPLLSNYNIRRAMTEVSRLGSALESKIAAYKQAQAEVADAEIKASAQFASATSSENTGSKDTRGKAEEAESRYLREIEAVVAQLDQYGSITSQYRDQANHNLSALEGGRSRLHGREPKRHYDHAAARMRREIGDCGSLLNTIQKYLEQSGKTLNYGSGSPSLARIYAPLAAVDRWKNSSAARSSDYTQQTISMLEAYATENKDRSTPPPRPALGGRHTRAEEDLPAKLTSGGAYASQRQVQRYAIPMSDVIRRLHPGRNLRNHQAGTYPMNGEEYRA